MNVFRVLTIFSTVKSSQRYLIEICTVKLVRVHKKYKIQVLSGNPTPQARRLKLDFLKSFWHPIQRKCGSHEKIVEAPIYTTNAVGLPETLTQNAGQYFKNELHRALKDGL
jgi:hypothetical protein